MAKQVSPSARGVSVKLAEGILPGGGVGVVGSDLGIVRGTVGIDGGEGEQEGGRRVVVVGPQRAAHAIEAPVGVRRRAARPAIGNDGDPVVGVVHLHRVDGGQVGLLGGVDRRLVAIAGLHEEIVRYVFVHVIILQIIDHDDRAEPVAQRSGRSGLSV